MTIDVNFSGNVIKTAEPGPCAFFDVDGTLINTRSLLGFLNYLKGADGMSIDRFDAYREELIWKSSQGLHREELNRFYYTIFQGLRVEVVEFLGRKWFTDMQSEPHFYNAAGVDILQRHKAEGMRICFVTGSLRELMIPLGLSLGAHAILCSDLEIQHGYFTGRLVNEPCIGLGKARAVKRFASRQGLDLSRCAAYGDDDSDRPMLNIVGVSKMLTPDACYAEEYEQVLRPAEATLRMEAQEMKAVGISNRCSD